MIGLWLFNPFLYILTHIYRAVKSAELQLLHIKKILEMLFQGFFYGMIKSFTGQNFLL